MRPLRWLSVAVPVIAVGVIELVSDGCSTASSRSRSTRSSWSSSSRSWPGPSRPIAFRQIDRLSAELRARNADLERREASARALHRVSVAIAALADLDEILQAIVDQARQRLDRDVAVLVAYRRRRRGVPGGRQRPARGRRSGRRLPGLGRRSVRPARVRDRPARSAAPAGRRDDRAADGRLARRPRASRSTRSRCSRRSRTRPPSRPRTRGSRRDCASSRSWPSGSASRARCTTASPRCSATSTPSRRPSRSSSPPVGSPRRAALLAELAAAARSIYVDIREAILGLRSPVVPGVGLVAAVEEYAARFAEAAKIAVHVEASEAARAARPRARGRGAGLPHRPGGADQRPQALGRWPGRDRLRHRGMAGSTSSSTMTARGPASRTPAADDRPRYGLRAMRERADSVGATVEWTSPPDGGCRVHLCVARRRGGPGRPGHRLMRIVLADDHALFRDGVSSLLQAWGHVVVGHAADGAEAVELVDAARAGPGPDGRPDAADERGRGDPGDRRGPPGDPDRHAHGQRGRGGPVRGDPGRRPRLPAQGPRGGRSCGR